MIETRVVKESADLLAITQKDTTLRRVASTNGGEYAGPCPFCGGEDRFRVQPLASRWLCRGCTDGRWQDAINYIQRRDGLSFVDACHYLNPNVVVSPKRKQAIATQQELLTPPDDDWQNRALSQAVTCADRLWDGANWIENKLNGQSNSQIDWTDSPSEARAFRWLNVNRGLKPKTIRAAMLGYNPQWDRGLPPGVTIPCFAGRELPLWYVKVRTFRSNLDKYLFLKDSVGKALYGADSLLEMDYAVIVEGEFDALLLQQTVKDLVAVVTMGSAGSIPCPTWQPYFALLRGAFITLDRDEAGLSGIEKWARLVPWLRPMPRFKITDAIRSNQAINQISRIKDITDYWACGGELRQWVNQALQGAR